MGAPGWVAGFDSATGMARALSEFLRGKDFPLLGMFPRITRPLWRAVGALVNALPRRLRKEIYIWSGWASGTAEGGLGGVRIDEAARWITSRYPRRRYPALMVGSADGALTHLAAAMRVPWLPQTLLIPVRRKKMHPDEAAAEMEWGRAPAEALLSANPDLVLHHMHDPVQDRLMIRRMSYFRIKLVSLPESYRRFLVETLPAGATLYVNDCRLRWPAVRVAPHHVFQPGAYNGIDPEEYLEGSDRVGRFLDREGSPVRVWDMPEPDEEAPEAEWGFDPALLTELGELADRQGWRIVHLAYPEPQSASPMIADLYRWWRARRGLDSTRLLVSSFILMDPWWTLRTGAVPFWTVFNSERSAAGLERYLDVTPPWDEIDLMLFSHGVESAGLAGVDRWRGLAERAARRGELLGVDPKAYPMDFAALIRYHERLPRQVAAREPVPAALSPSDAEGWLRENGGRYGVEVID